MIYGDRYSDVIGLAYEAMHLVTPFFVVTCFVLLPFCLLGPAWRLAVFLAAAYAYDVAAIAVFGGFSAPRYEDVFILLPVMLTCLGAHFAILTFRQRSRLRFAGASATPPGGGAY